MSLMRMWMSITASLNDRFSRLTSHHWNGVCLLGSERTAKNLKLLTAGVCFALLDITETCVGKTRTQCWQWYSVSVRFKIHLCRGL